MFKYVLELKFETLLINNLYKICLYPNQKDYHAVIKLMATRVCVAAYV